MKKCYLRNVIFSLKHSESPSLDGIRKDDIRRNFEILEDIMLFIFNVPVEGKQAFVKPFYQRGQRRDVPSFRAMSILTSLS